MYEIKKDVFKNINDPYDYFISAQRDIMNISNTVESKRFPLEDNIETICRSAAESVEKMLKGWIIYNNNNLNVYGIHDLGKLNEITFTMNNSFSEIVDKMINLNNYTTSLRYSSQFIVENK